MNILFHIFIIIICCLVLWGGACWLVDSAARLAKRLGISELVIGLTIVAFGTSAPEFAVTIAAALGGNPDISVGNIVGSNIFNIGFILGGCAILISLRSRPSLVWRDGLLLLGVTLLLMYFLRDQQLTRPEGAILFAILLAYLFYLSVKREPILDEELSVKSATWRDGLLLPLSLLMIIAGGYFLKESAVKIALAYKLSEWVIGVTIVAAGTSVPEFAISLIALLKRHHGLSAGNLIGSNIFNTLGVLGLAGTLHPLQVESSSLFSIGALAVLTLLVLIFLRTGWKISRWEGLLLLLLSLAVWLYNIFVFARPE